MYGYNEASERCSLGDARSYPDTFPQKTFQFSNRNRP